MKKRIAPMLLGAGLLLWGRAPQADDAGFKIEANATMHDVLAQQAGKRATLRLGSGAEIEGTITLVGDQLVHISRLTGKEFYDAVVSIDRISAVVLRAH
jgi:hypothetical protein